jgi:DNA/RNA-binding domain of Phe-tRNA-synthetase-like protein
MTTRLVVAQTWRDTYPGASVGILTLHDVANQGSCAALDDRKAWLESSLRRRFEGQGRDGIKALPTIRAYAAYYKQFRKTYHVQLQLESVALKGRPIANESPGLPRPLVEAMFVTELDHLLLTAGHDLDLVAPPLALGVADGTESYVRINGEQQVLAKGDMVISDALSVLSSIIHGPDRRTMLRPETRNAIFTVYAPEGIEVQAVEAHLQALRDSVRLIAPQARVGILEVIS